MDWSGAGELARKQKSKNSRNIRHLWKEYVRLRDTYEPESKLLKAPIEVKELKK